MSSDVSRAIEAILMVAQEPVDPHLLAQLLEVAPARVTEAVDELRAAYEADERGFVLVEVAGGFRFQSHPDLAPYVERFALEGQSARLSNAALETLAIIAYKQPLSRAQIAAIRGVNVDGVIRTLTQRGYIAEVGRDPGGITRTHAPDCLLFDSDADLRRWLDSPGGGHLWGEQAPDDYVRDNFVGTDEQVAEKVQGFVDAGCREFVLWFRDYPGVESLERFQADVVPRVSGP